jgi:hypothetical protein
MELIFSLPLSLLYLQVTHIIIKLLHTPLRSCIGEFESWPSIIFQLCVCGRPSVTNIRKVADFFYGNDLSFRYASFFYPMCNERGSALTTTNMFTFHYLWHSDQTTSHHTKYYNMKHKTLMWINGSDDPQLEPVVVVDSRYLVRC